MNSKFLSDLPTLLVQTLTLPNETELITYHPFNYVFHQFMHTKEIKGYSDKCAPHYA